MDIDDILRAQGSDGESDEDEEEREGILDAEAFDRRLEEILKGEVEDDEDSDGGGKFSVNVRRSELPSDPLQGGTAKLEAAKFASRQEDSGSVAFERYREKGSSSAHKESICLSEFENEKDVAPRFSCELRSPSKDAWVSSEASAENIFSSQRDAKAEDDLPGAFPQKMAENLNDISSTTLRTGAVLTAVAAASTESTTPQMSNSIRYGLAGDADSPVTIGPLSKQIADVSNAYSESVLQSDLSEKEKDDNLKQAAHNPPSSFTSTEGKSIYLAQSVQDETFSSDDVENEAFDVESGTSDNKSIILSSDDDSEQEEIKSILSRELVASEAEVISRSHTSVSENSPFEVVRSTSRKLVEPQLSALDKAEEAEKKAAVSGFGIEEGAASQPMRLKGMQTGPPKIGYVRFDILNSVSQILSLGTTTREHGVAQAISMHGHHLAVGLSKGSVFLLSLRSSGGKVVDAVDKVKLAR
ncbi:hypothetical protein L7F22_065927 [Adiantum nelumboides]|nr:hypothetical protein [Adiantum nelumboides]